eukprot:TRINITY_DN1115_c0_g1_i1.p2 TRINITY_DN1115_c0_g1~~TRINITY_DN1115_c0_g1_i1.p2  ORF type:complete len:286 (+),score=83.68 TRINITY_DN1115_c0_g1_i1:1717-2574(+)
MLVGFPFLLLAALLQSSLPVAATGASPPKAAWPFRRRNPKSWIKDLQQQRSVSTSWYLVVLNGSGQTVRPGKGNLTTGRMGDGLMTEQHGTESLSEVVHPIQLQPMEIYVDDEAKLTLHGLVQHYIKLEEKEKNRKLNDLLDALDFNQVVIFVKSVSRAAELNKLLVECNFPSICIHSGLTQEERLNRYKNFKDGLKRILVATDLVGRGIDIERVNIVINYDMPENADSYLHRVGRAGRFGTKGLAITFVASEEDVKILNDVQERFEVDIKELPEQIDTSTYMPA